MNNNSQDEINSTNCKAKVLTGISLALGIILIFRLFYLQILNYKTITQKAQYATSKISILTAPRGFIFDRNGKILATNKQAISVIVYPNKLKTQGERLIVYNNLKKIFKKNINKLRETFIKLPDNTPLPIRLASNISIEEAIQIVEKQHLLKGIDIQEEPIRFYPNKVLASHVIGYISQINKNELLLRPDRKLGDIVGKYGIEKLFDDILRGIDGKDIVEVDRFGKPIDPSYKHGEIHMDPLPGKNIYLTLDIDIQRACEEALRDINTNSSCIVADVNSGEVLALASYPNFDLNIFTTNLPTDTWKNLLAKKALLNRALLAYTPGSIWKPITLISALESMVVKASERFKVSEAHYLGNTRFGDWTDKEGILSLEESLAWSRDTAFYQIGERLNPEQIKKWGITLGAGRKTGIELTSEEEGVVPDKNWKKKNLNEPWYPGNTLHYSIGQGFVLITPLQASRIYTALATGSTIPKLRLLKQIHNYKVPQATKEKFDLDQNLLRVVRSGLELCIEKGTGIASKLEKIKIAGKTGSAEVSGAGKTHSWFAAYAPANKPEIVVVVLAEKAGHGGTVAAPIAKKVLERYFNLKNN